MQASEYARRRKNLLRIMGDSNSIAIIPSAQTQIRSRDVERPFRQDSDFSYLSGFPEPESVIVMVPDRKHGEYLLFCREKDAEQETWHGRRQGLEGALESHAANDAFPIDDLDDILPGLLEGRERIYYSMGSNPKFDARVIEWVNSVRRKTRADAETPGEFISLEFYLHDMRLYKSRAEIAVMRKAAKISAAAHHRAMRLCRPGLMEYQIEAEFAHEFRKHGCDFAYPSIIGGGENGCILHYTENNAELKDGELLLIDAGAEYQGYASDISRTFPVNGEFTTVQRDVYEIVLEAQLSAIDKIKPGNHWNDPHDAAVKVLTKGLLHLGVLKGKLAKLLKDQAYRPFYMHRTGHWLGMDVHDVGDYKVDGEWRLLEPGMLMTVEPGLYITPGAKVPKALHNIGIRIEDDVAVTRTGYDVLSADAVKSVADIEQMMASGLG